MGKVECLSETLNTTLETIQNELRGQQVEITQLTAQDEQQQVKIGELTSDNEVQKVEIQRISTENAEQGAQLTQQKSDIEHLTTQNEWQQILLDKQKDKMSVINREPRRSAPEVAKRTTPQWVIIL